MTFSHAEANVMNTWTKPRYINRSEENNEVLPEPNMPSRGAHGSIERLWNGLLTGAKRTSQRLSRNLNGFLLMEGHNSEFTFSDLPPSTSIQPQFVPEPSAPVATPRPPKSHSERRPVQRYTDEELDSLDADFLDSSSEVSTIPPPPYEVRVGTMHERFDSANDEDVAENNPPFPSSVNSRSTRSDNSERFHKKDQRLTKAISSILYKSFDEV
eukprot:CAMPEP_0204863660 /NCGR_PEP_ID=MMETSP1348-20121228/3478_1 /ASSEMBLY_ACC=CAM_ASM_000700 /TAXON_ID=215587 /ORGANISM="Aplanochytrium stocchinoi, Strain GSBS06" /LENGTH=212 /DNA_ID=CAMNT_0052014049 /DNA_START=108 /DNA_END=746 /DNA_ORIENTATION=-